MKENKLHADVRPAHQSNDGRYHYADLAYEGRKRFLAEYAVTVGAAFIANHNHDFGNPQAMLVPRVQFFKAEDLLEACERMDREALGYKSLAFARDNEIDGIYMPAEHDVIRINADVDDADIMHVAFHELVHITHREEEDAEGFARYMCKRRGWPDLCTLCR